MHSIREFNRHARRFKALVYGLKHPMLLKTAIRDAISFLYAEGCLKKRQLPRISAEGLFNTEVKLLNFHVRDGNVTPLELLIISSLVASKNPLNLLEIGTFDGNTTLQMALNCSSKATVHTIDLEEGRETELPILEEDVKYVLDSKKVTRKFIGTCVQEKIMQHFGDSTVYDFSKMGRVDFCFIDGGHTYDCVKKDSEKVFSILAEGGMVLWHDFTPNCPGVYRYLMELSKTMPLAHIYETQLVMYGS